MQSPLQFDQTAGRALFTEFHPQLQQGVDDLGIGGVVKVSQFLPANRFQ